MQRSIVLVVAIGAGAIALRQLAPVTPAKTVVPSSGQPQPRLDDEFSRQPSAAGPEAAVPAERPESNAEASKVDTFWESLRKFPGVEEHHYDGGLQVRLDAKARAAALEWERKRLSDALAWRGVKFDEAMARCGSTQVLQGADEEFCREIRLSADQCERLHRAPAEFEEFVDAAEAIPAQERVGLAAQARSLAPFVALARNLCAL